MVPSTRQIQDTLKAKLPASTVAVYLFGSFARGTARADSDVDLGVLLTKPPPATLMGGLLDVEGQLESDFGRRVQLVLMNEAPVDLIHRILRDGELLVENDHFARVSFEVKARNEYFDLEPFLRRYREQPESAA